MIKLPDMIYRAVQVFSESLHHKSGIYQILAFLFKQSQPANDNQVDAEFRLALRS